MSDRARASSMGLAAAAACVLGAVLCAAGCDDDPTIPNLEYMPDMVSSVAYDSFAPNPNTRDGRTLMAPPPGTIPRGYHPVHFTAGPSEAARAGRELANPVPDAPFVLQRGEVAFQRWCSPCHGAGGEADGLVARRFPRPPSLVAEHARKLPDGQIFHIVTFGQGVMPAYGSQVVEGDRWKVVRFLRRMQATAVAATAMAAVAGPKKPAITASAPPTPPVTAGTAATSAPSAAPSDAGGDRR